MKFLRVFDRALARVEGWFIVVFLSLMVGMTFIQVVLRGLFTHAHLQWANQLMGLVDWTELFVRLLVLWITFLGASLLTGDNKHIKIDLMSAVLPTRWLPLRELILSTACVFIMALMVNASIGYVRVEMEYSSQMFLNIPGWVGQLILPAGFSLLFFRFFIRGLEKAIEIFGGSGA